MPRMNRSPIAQSIPHSPTTLLALEKKCGTCSPATGIPLTKHESLALQQHANKLSQTCISKILKSDPYSISHDITVLPWNRGIILFLHCMQILTPAGDSTVVFHLGVANPPAVLLLRSMALVDEGLLLLVLLMTEIKIHRLRLLLLYHYLQGFIRASKVVQDFLSQPYNWGMHV